MCMQYILCFLYITYDLNNITSSSDYSDFVKRGSVLAARLAKQRFEIIYIDMLFKQMVAVLDAEGVEYWWQSFEWIARVFSDIRQVVGATWGASELTTILKHLISP